jgi:hypothetical protein
MLDFQERITNVAVGRTFGILMRDITHPKNTIFGIIFNIWVVSYLKSAGIEVFLSFMFTREFIFMYRACIEWYGHEVI